LTRSRRLVRSDLVAHLTAVGREALVDYGVSTVLDLRSESEVRATPNPFADSTGPRYLHHVLIEDSRMTSIGDAQSMLDRYISTLELGPQAFRDVFNAIAESDGCVLFHCFAGKDRTGVVSAMLLAMAGVPRDDIAADYAGTDVQLASQYERWISEAAPERRDAFRDELRCPPERILGVLDHLQARWGGVEGYLETAGVQTANIERLVAKLTNS
jgi:protein-tyrosine phosphatase